MSLWALTLLAPSVLPLAARADTIDDFVLTGDGHTLTFSLASTATFANHSKLNSFLDGGPGTVDGVSGYSFGLTVFVYPASRGGFQLSENPYNPLLPNIDLYGSMLVQYVNSNPVTDPVLTVAFIPGHYTLANNPFAPGAGNVPDLFTLDITPETSSPVPEPPGLALVATGLIALRGALRRSLPLRAFYAAT